MSKVFHSFVLDPLQDTFDSVEPHIEIFNTKWWQGELKGSHLCEGLISKNMPDNAEESMVARMGRFSDTNQGQQLSSLSTVLRRKSEIPETC